MKVRVNLVIEVDPQNWARSTGQGVDEHGRCKPAELREDVRNYYLYLAQGASITEETSAQVSLGGKGA